jgi:hypothetical protein
MKILPKHLKVLILLNGFIKQVGIQLNIIIMIHIILMKTEKRPFIKDQVVDMKA